MDPVHMQNTSSTYLSQKAIWVRSECPDWKNSTSNRDMNSSARRDPSGDPIGIPMSRGTRYNKSLCWHMLGQRHFSIKDSNSKITMRGLLLLQVTRQYAHK